MDGDDQLSTKVHLTDTNIINSSTSAGYDVNLRWGYWSIYLDHWKATYPDTRTEFSRETILKQGITCGKVKKGHVPKGLIQVRFIGKIISKIPKYIFLLLIWRKMILSTTISWDYTQPNSYIHRVSKAIIMSSLFVFIMSIWIYNSAIWWEVTFIFWYGK